MAHRADRIQIWDCATPEVQCGGEGERPWVILGLSTQKTLCKSLQNWLTVCKHIFISTSFQNNVEAYFFKGIYNSDFSLNPLYWDLPSHYVEEFEAWTGTYPFHLASQSPEDDTLTFFSFAFPSLNSLFLSIHILSLSPCLSYLFSLLWWLNKTFPTEM